jgi:hypothetical protein
MENKHENIELISVKAFFYSYLQWIFSVILIKPILKMIMLFPIIFRLDNADIKTKLLEACLLQSGVQTNGSALFNMGIITFKYINHVGICKSNSTEGKF